MIHYSYKNIVLVGMLSMAFLSVKSFALDLPYLDDSSPSPQVSLPVGAPDYSGDMWPRTILAETKSMAGELQRYAKYNLIATQASLMPLVAILQEQYPHVRYMRMFTPRENQEYESGLYCTQGKGIPFEETGLATEGCAVYAGHWLYSGGTTINQVLDTSSTEISVSQPDLFTVGQYAVIYDAPASSFHNAEHVKITAINGDLLTVQRGYKSTPAVHSAGSIIAQHVLGQGGNHPLNWSYNLSTACPKDANGNDISTIMANFLRDNLHNNRFGEAINIDISGILFDVDFYFELGKKQSDVDNDLIVDHGFSTSGYNMWGEGIEVFYNKVRAVFPLLHIVGGTENSRGFGSLSGTQVESWLGGFGQLPDYKNLDQLFNKYIFALSQYSDAPLHTHVLNKQSTGLYPKYVPVLGNSSFRIGLGLALMGDGYYGQENHPDYPDTWYDEYAVDVIPGSTTYGHAISSAVGNEEAIIANIGWLGKPKSEFKRLYNANEFSEEKSLVFNGSFESNLEGWKTRGSVVTSLDNNTGMDGQSSISAAIGYTQYTNGASIEGIKFTLEQDKEYTLSFAAKSEKIREITSKIASAAGTVGQRFFVGSEWTRKIMTLKATHTGDHSLSFLLGKEDADVWIDSVYLFEGNANIFRRDFENGIVVVNATPSERTIMLGAPYQKILGTQDSINDGADVNGSITLPPYDGILLVNKAGYDYGGNGYISLGEECGKPSINPESDLSLLVWKDCVNNKWFIHASGGGSDGIVYQGNIDSNEMISDVGETQIEDTDVILLENNDLQLKFTLRVWKDGQDEVEFRIDDLSDACLSMNRAQIKVGPNRTSVPVPFNLRTLGGC